MKSARRRWPWILAAAGLAVVVLAAIAVPLLLDVERHRGRIEGALHDATGWDAQLGDMDFSVLGGLSLDVSPVQLQAPEGGSRFDVGNLSVRARLLPLLRGNLEIESVVLERPEMTVVRSDPDRGWILPFAHTRDVAPGGAAPGAERKAPVAIERIDVSAGALRLEDRSVEPAPVLRIESVDAELLPATGSLRGDGSFADDGGQVRWSGTVNGRLDVKLEGVRTDVLAPWLGEGVLHPGGRVAGDVEIDLPEGISGSLTAESLRVLAGAKPLPETELTFRLAPTVEGWSARQLTIRSGDAKVEGRGSLVPLALEFELPPTPLETALALSDAAFPLGLQVTPPGTVAARVKMDLTDAGVLTYEAAGEVSAAGFVAAEILPSASDLRAEFKLSRAGRLDLRILEATVAGGPLEGKVYLDSIDPPGKLVFEGGLSGASLGVLLGGFIEDAPERITGPTALTGKIEVDLGGVVDASAIRGELSVSSDGVDLAGWDLEGSLRQSIRDKLGKLGDLVSRIDGDSDRKEPDPARRLLDRLGTNAALEGPPWTLRALELRAGGLSATGQGRFDPVKGDVDLEVVVELDEPTTKDYVGRYPQLRSLVDGKGHLILPARLRGPMTGPKFTPDLEKLVSPPREEAEKAVRGLLKGILKDKPDR